MKSIKYILTSAALLAAFCACNKEIEVEPTDSIQTGEKQIITATVNVGTKVTYSENTPGGGSGISSVWAAGDKFYAIQDGNTVVTFNIVDGVGNTSATFQAEATGVTASTTWKAVLGGHASVHGTEIHCGYTDQGGFVTSLNNYNYVVADGTGLTPSFDFENGQKLTYLMRIKLPAGIKCIEYTCPAVFKVTASGVETMYAKGENDPYSTIPTRTITLSSPSASGDIVYVSVPAVNHNSKAWSYNSGKQVGNLRTGVIITILNDTSDDATASTGAVLDKDLSAKGGQIGTFDMTGMTLLKRPKVSDAIIVNSTQVCWTRTGLTQSAESLGTGWAPYNIGAEQPYEMGNRYACGESQPKSTYDNGSYSLRGSAALSGRPNYIAVKVNSPSPNNYFTIGGGRYDTARVLWGSAWRMPNIIEFLALDPKKGHACSVSTISGQKCYVSEGVTLPIVGYIDGTELKHDGDGTTWDFVAWSTTIINQKNADAGWDTCYAFDAKLDGTPDKDRIAKSCGLPVRAVLASSEITWATQTYSY